MRLSFLLALFFLWLGSLEATPFKLHSFGVKISKTDSSKINILYYLPWNVTAIQNNSFVNCTNCKADSVFEENNKLHLAVLTTHIVADTSLLNKLFVFSYELIGSARILINNQLIAESGTFASLKDNSQNKFNFKGAQTLFLKDTSLSISVEYIPHPRFKKWDIDLNIEPHHHFLKTQLNKAFETNEFYSLCFFYLAFAIIFLILFLFSKNNHENLYFALFSLFASLSFLLHSGNYGYVAKFFSYYSVVFSLESLAIFFSITLLNDERSKIWLILITIITASCYYLYIQDGNDWVRIIPFLLLVIFTCISCLYYFIQAFGQKKWEVRTILIGSSFGILFNAIVPTVVAIKDSFSGADVNRHSKVMSLAADFGLCSYPLAVAFVLGMRNRRSQKQLAENILSIETLSKENLAKETEKKKILEEQNVFLETKVKERTRELAVKNDVISVKNKEITDSLVYAKRIQNAILPDIKRIYNTLQESFILYLPKDIVSGDFYAFSQKDNKVIIAAADCTGHGVAGAFMSMIGSSLLNTIVNEKNILSPARILDELNVGIIDSLKQKESNSNDGMDIAICAFNFDANCVEFAGANRPLWLVRNGELIVFKPNKFPIGGQQVERREKFFGHEIQLQKNDTLYLFSDGFADQFGGEKGKKLMTRKFKDALLDIQNLSMQKQEMHLHKLFNDWKGENEQVDDVLVIGIRI